MCVCERERERERELDIQSILTSLKKWLKDSKGTTKRQETYRKIDRDRQNTRMPLG